MAKRLQEKQIKSGKDAPENITPDIFIRPVVSLTNVLIVTKFLYNVTLSKILKTNI